MKHDSPDRMFIYENIGMHETIGNKAISNTFSHLLMIFPGCISRMSTFVPVNMLPNLTRRQNIIPRIIFHSKYRRFRFFTFSQIQHFICLRVGSSRACEIKYTCTNICNMCV